MGRWIHTFTRCPVSVAARSEAKLSPKQYRERARVTPASSKRNAPQHQKRGILIQLTLVVGICGACPHGEKNEEMIMGDIVLSEGVIEYDMGRQFLDTFIRKPLLNEILGRPNLEI